MSLSRVLVLLRHTEALVVRVPVLEYNGLGDNSSAYELRVREKKEVVKNKLSALTQDCEGRVVCAHPSAHREKNTANRRR